MFWRRLSFNDVRLTLSSNCRGCKSLRINLYLTVLLNEKLFSQLFDPQPSFKKREGEEKSSIFMPSLIGISRLVPFKCPIGF